MATIPARTIYETGGWTDGRLGQAYDLVSKVLEDRHIQWVGSQLLREIEHLDVSIANEPRPSVGSECR